MFAIADARMLTASYTSGGAITSDTRGDVFMLYDFGYSGTYFMGFNGSAVTTSETQLFRTTGRCQANIQDRQKPHNSTKPPSWYHHLVASEFLNMTAVWILQIMNLAG
jgi:hypothetical protein